MNINLQKRISGDCNENNDEESINGAMHVGEGKVKEE